MIRLCRLMLCITQDKSHQWYIVRKASQDIPDGTVAWQLVKGDKTCYTVSWGPHGASCECADAVYRKNNSPEVCKHVAALQTLGLLPKE